MQRELPALPQRPLSVQSAVLDTIRIETKTGRRVVQPIEDTHRRYMVSREVHPVGWRTEERDHIVKPRLSFRDGHSFRYAQALELIAEDAGVLVASVETEDSRSER